MNMGFRLKHLLATSYGIFSLTGAASAAEEYNQINSSRLFQLAERPSQDVSSSQSSDDARRFEAEKQRRKIERSRIEDSAASLYASCIKASLEKAWHAPQHSGLLVTKRRIFLNQAGTITKQQVIADSISKIENESVDNVLESLKFAALPPELSTLELNLSFMSDGTMNMVEVKTPKEERPMIFTARHHEVGGGHSVAPSPTRARSGGGGGGGGPAIAVAPSVPRFVGGGGEGQRVSPSGTAQADVDFGPYMADLQRRIKRAWFPPKGYEDKRVVVVFKVHRGGELSHLRLDHSSGVTVADEAALNAVQKAAKFRPLPAGAPDDVDIQYTFDYNVFSGGGRGVFRQF